MSNDNKIAINRLIEFNSSMVRFAGSLCNDWHLAQDIAQEALYKAMKCKRLGQITNLEAWIFTVIRNVWIDKCRKVSRRPKHQTMNTDEGTVESIGAVYPRPSIEFFERFGTSGSNLDMIFSDSTARALQQIPDVYKEALLLSDVHGNTYNEVAKILKVPVGTVRSRIYRGRTLLKGLLSSTQSAT